MMKVFQSLKEQPFVKALQGALQEKLPALQKALEPLLAKLRPLMPRAAAPAVKEAPHIFACDYGASKMLFLEAATLPDGALRVESLKLFRRPKEQSAAVDLIRQALAGVSDPRVRISIKGQSVITRFIQLPKMEPAEMRSAITYEAENYIPFKVDDVILDFQVLGTRKNEAGNEMADVLLVAVRKEEIYPLVKDFQDADVALDCIDVDILAALNSLEFFHKDLFSKSTVAFLDIGKEITSMSVTVEGKPRFLRDLSFGSNDIVKRLRRKIGLSVEDADMILEGEKVSTPETDQVLTEAFETFCGDLKVTLDYYQGQVADSKPVDLVFLAGGGCLGLLQKVSQESLGIPVMLLDVDHGVQMGDNVDRALFAKSKNLLAVAFGLCLRG